MAEYLAGNAELVEALGRDVVGEPLTDEIVVLKRYDGRLRMYLPRITRQYTTRGVIEYVADLPGLGVAGSRFYPFT